MVEIKDLTKKYGDNVAVCDISFSLEQGKIYGLLGPNGAGKSTTMNMMTGYLAPSKGTVEIDGISMDKDAKKAKKHIGYLPENPPLYPDMTVHEYLKFVAELKGVKKKERYEKVEQLMELVGVTDMANRLIKNLSKGYKQRVGLAGAMTGEPSVIILDEPTVGLDPKQVIEFRELIKSFGKERIVMISSHILSEISAVCDHVFIINNGRLLVDDAVDKLDSYISTDSTVRITIKGDENTAKEALLALDGIKSVNVVSRDDGNTLLSVNAASSDGITEKISLGLMEKRIPILGMIEEKGSLEQIFLEITKADDAEIEADMNEAEDEVHIAREENDTDEAVEEAAEETKEEEVEE